MGWYYSRIIASTFSASSIFGYVALTPYAKIVLPIRCLSVVLVSRLLPIEQLRVLGRMRGEQDTYG